MKKISYSILYLLLLLFMVGCSTPAKQKYAPQLYGQTELLSENIKKEFLSFNYPEGVIPILVSEKTIPDPIKTGAFADNIFDEISPKLEAEKFNKFGLLIVITQDPKLIQVRLGSYYDRYANLCGINMGKQYVELQKQYSYENKDYALHEMLVAICNNITIRKELNWNQSNQLNNINNAINQALEWLGTPSETFYGTHIARPIYYVISFGSNLFKSWWAGLLLLFGLILLTRILINRLLNCIPILLLRLILTTIVNFALGLVISIPIMGCVSFLSSGRLEDLIALKSFGIPYVESFILSPDMFVQETNIWLTGIFMFFLLLSLCVKNRYFLLALLPDTIQQKYWQSLPNEQKAYIPHGYEVKADDSSPYMTILTSYWGESTAKVAFPIAIATLFFFPKAVLWTGIGYSIITILGEYNNYKEIVRQYKNTTDDISVPIKAIIYIVICVFYAGLVTVGAWYFDPFDKKSASQQEIEITQTVSETTSKKEENSQNQSGQKENVQNKKKSPTKKTDVIKEVYIVETASLLSTPQNQHSFVKKNDNEIIFTANKDNEICQLKKGQRLEVLQISDEWYKVRIPNTSTQGYIQKVFCK